MYVYIGVFVSPKHIKMFQYVEMIEPRYLFLLVVGGTWFWITACFLLRLINAFISEHGANGNVPRQPLLSWYWFHNAFVTSPICSDIGIKGKAGVTRIHMHKQRISMHMYICVYIHFRIYVISQFHRMLSRHYNRVPTIIVVWNDYLITLLYTVVLFLEITNCC